MYRPRIRRRRGICLPGYRYCGPGCSGPGNPINVLDAICLEHDGCIRQTRNRWDCDQKMLAQLRPLLRLSNRIGRDARLVYAFVNLRTKF